MSTQLYQLKQADFYDEQVRSKNPLRKWFHETRHAMIGSLVRKYHTGGMIVDVGSGNCLWNQRGWWNVVGIDINQLALDYCIQKGRISRGLLCEANKIALPDNSADVVVCSEVLEHLQNYPEAIKEAYRILRPGGTYITSVPHDTRLSLWRPLFKVQCLYQGYVKGDEYYKQECGHINHFSPSTIALHLMNARFMVAYQHSMKRFTVFTVSVKGRV